MPAVVIQHIAVLVDQRHPQIFDRRSDPSHDVLDAQPLAERLFVIDDQQFDSGFAFLAKMLFICRKTPQT